MANTESNSSVGICRGGAQNLGQAPPAPKQLNLKSLAMEADPKVCGCPTKPRGPRRRFVFGGGAKAEPILESRAVYTVKNLSELSGVTVRALHFYEEAGLLKPAYYGSNGYRHYEEKELLRLQQILFFKELGFTLKQIQKVLGRSDFDQLAALYSHKQSISREWNRLGRLMETIDKTIDHIKGKDTMKEEEFYGGFITKEKQKEYLEYLKNRLGEDHYSFAECEKNAKKLTKEDFAKQKEEAEQNWTELAKLWKNNAPVDSKEMQAIVRKLYIWVKQFWTPTRETFIGLGQGYTEFEWKKWFCKWDPEHPRLAKYLAEGMRIFAERELT